MNIPTLQELQAMDLAQRTRAFKDWCATQSGTYEFLDHWRCPLARFGAAVVRIEGEPPEGSNWDWCGASQRPVGTGNGFVPSIPDHWVGDLCSAPGHLEVVPHLTVGRFRSYRDLAAALSERAYFGGGVSEMLP